MNDPETLEELKLDLIRKGHLLISEGHPYCGYAFIGSADDLARIAKLEEVKQDEGSRDISNLHALQTDSAVDQSNRDDGTKR